MTESQIALMLSVVMACLFGPVILLRGRVYIKGYRPESDSTEYTQALRHINYLNILSGSPIQIVIYDPQWVIIGYIRSFIGSSLCLWIPIGIGLVISYWPR